VRRRSMATSIYTHDTRPNCLTLIGLSASQESVVSKHLLIAWATGDEALSMFAGGGLALFSREARLWNAPVSAPMPG
jgi:hypothetical protein